jgi:tRNA (mo5U34)-methyltransferase
MTDSSQKYQNLLQWLPDSPLSSWSDRLPELLEKQLRLERWGDMPSWQQCLERLPEIDPLTLDFSTAVSIGDPNLMDKGRRLQLQATLMALHPWRKGPYELFGLHLDTEWRSDWKWDRLLPHISPLKDRLVLDVGCGNGYHCWRMLGAGAKRVIGIDPSPKSVFQFHAIKHFAGSEHPVDILPLGIEHMEHKLKAFDSIFSMGVLYHRRSPIDHLQALKDLLRPGGQLILETLIIEGSEGEILVPEGRYGKMPNVWFLPTPETLISWLRKLGFSKPRLVNVNKTTVDEQRTTPWMTFESLADFLHPTNPDQTIEGYPAPRRGIFIAEAS